MRNPNGTFAKGNTAALGHGRPEGAGKVYVKDMCWDSINTVAHAIFGMPEAEMKAWFATNKDSLSLGERLYIEAATNNLAVIEALLDRIVGRTLKIDASVGSSEPIMDYCYRLTPEGRRQEIERLQRNRAIIEREKESIRNRVV